jgi:hypothetical protein
MVFSQMGKADADVATCEALFRSLYVCYKPGSTAIRGLVDKIFFSVDGDETPGNAQAGAGQKYRYLAEALVCGRDPRSRVCRKPKLNAVEEEHYQLDSQAINELDPEVESHFPDYSDPTDAQLLGFRKNFMGYLSKGYLSKASILVLAPSFQELCEDAPYHHECVKAGVPELCEKLLAAVAEEQQLLDDPAPDPSTLAERKRAKNMAQNAYAAAKETADSRYAALTEAEQVPRMEGAQKIMHAMRH